MKENTLKTFAGHQGGTCVCLLSVCSYSSALMDIQTLLNNLHEELSCSVCMSKYTDPKQLPCLHSFCLRCLNGIQRTSGRRDKIACPECRQEFNVPDNGNLNALPTNFRINSLLDVLAIRSATQPELSVEIATKERNRAIIVSNVMLSGAKSALVSTIGSRQIKIIMRWP